MTWSWHKGLVTQYWLWFKLWSGLCVQIRWCSIYSCMYMTWCLSIVIIIIIVNQPLCSLRHIGSSPAIQVHPRLWQHQDHCDPWGTYIYTCTGSSPANARPGQHYGCCAPWGICEALSQLQHIQTRSIFPSKLGISCLFLYNNVWIWQVKKLYVCVHVWGFFSDPVTVHNNMDLCWNWYRCYNCSSANWYQNHWECRKLCNLPSLLVTSWSWARKVMPG